MTIYDYFYYLILLIVNVYCLKKIPPLSLSGISTFLNVFFLIIPGYFIYRGGVELDRASLIDMKVYFLLFFQSLIIPIIGFFVWNTRSKIKLIIKPRKFILITYIFFLLLVVVYDAFYIKTFLNQIPLLEALSGDKFHAAVDRTLLTQLNDNDNVEWYFKYSKFFLKDITFFLLLPLFVFDLSMNSLSRVLIAIICLFILMLHIEKSYLLLYFFALLIVKNNFLITYKKAIVFLGGFMVLAILGNLYLFTNSVIGSIEYIPYRLMAQSGYVKTQLDIFNQLDLNGFNIINFGILKNLFNAQYVDISKLAWRSVHEDLYKLGIDGTSGGASIVEAYMIFGWYCLILSPVFLYMTLSLDKLIRTSMICSVNSFSEKIRCSFYVLFICFYPFNVVGSAFGIFNPIYFFTQSLLVVVFIFFMMFKVCLLRISH
jgi:hypothetical protein